MKKLFVFLAMLGFGVAAQASTTTNFGPATSCPTYCTGFTTDNPSVTVNYVNVTSFQTGRLVVGVNGVSYSGYGVAFLPVAVVGTHTVYRGTGTLTAADGSAITVTVLFDYWKTKIVSGRDAGRYTQHYFVDSGSVTQ